MYADPAVRLCVVDGTIKGDGLSFIGVYTPNDHMVRVNFFWQIDPFVASSIRVVLAGHWNASLDPDIDRGGIRLNTNYRDVVPFRGFIDRMDLVDKFRNEHPNEVVWTWTNNGNSNTVQHPSYID